MCSINFRILSSSLSSSIPLEKFLLVLLFWLDIKMASPERDTTPPTILATNGSTVSLVRRYPEPQVILMLTGTANEPGHH